MFVELLMHGLNKLHDEIEPQDYKITNSPGQYYKVDEISENANNNSFRNEAFGCKILPNC